MNAGRRHGRRGRRARSPVRSSLPCPAARPQAPPAAARPRPLPAEPDRGRCRQEPDCGRCRPEPDRGRCRRRLGACATAAGRRVRRPAREPAPDEHRAVGRQVHAGAAAQADAGLVLERHGTGVGVMDGAERLQVGGEVAARIARAAVEDVAGAPGAARHERALPALGALDLEGQWRRGRRARAVDVVALGVAVAAREDPEAPARATSVPSPALRARLADAVARPAAPAPRRGAAASPCARDRASRPGSARCGRAG